MQYLWHLHVFFLLVAFGLHDILSTFSSCNSISYEPILKDFIGNCPTIEEFYIHLQSDTNPLHRIEALLFCDGVVECGL